MPQDFKITSVTQAFDDADQYGNITWSVGWEGASDHALLKTRPDNEPKVGDVVFGELEPTKSGKATWLKKKKRDDYPQQSAQQAPHQTSQQAAPQPSGPVQSLDERIRSQVIFKGAITIWTNGAEKSIPQSVSDAIDMMETVESQLERRVEEKAAAKKDAKAYAAEQYNKVLQEVEENVPF